MFRPAFSQIRSWAVSAAVAVAASVRVMRASVSASSSAFVSRLPGTQAHVQSHTPHMRAASLNALRAGKGGPALVRIALCALCAGAVLSACSPTFDWRTIMNNDNGYTVDFPAKPGNDERQIDIDGRPMTMAMQTAEAGHAVFAVGTVNLPGDDQQTQRAALDFLRTGLARHRRPGRRPGNEGDGDGRCPT
jgi:hypothetical protein